MYSQEDRLRAVRLYLELDNNAALTVRRLGYPNVTTLAYWVDEYQRKHSLHPQRRRYSKYSAEEKAHAVHYYMEHGVNILQTVKVLGYPSRPLFKAWIEEKKSAKAEKRCQTSKLYVKCTQEERERAVLESCQGTLKIHEIAEIYNVTPSAVSTWRKKLLGKGRTLKMSTIHEQDKDVIQLKKEKLVLEVQVQTLKKRPINSSLRMMFRRKLLNY